MLNEDGSLVLVFNGEIYNYQEIRKNFANEITFRRNNDSEVILKLYEKFGPGCLDHLRGMFALAIWDANRSELFLARDRLGKKPFFYTIQNQALAFASELHALLANRDFRFEVDPGAISRYLSLQYIPGTSLQWFEEQFADFGGVPYPENLMAMDIRTYLPDDLLVKSDIATMYCALEARSPFLDHKLMEFAATLPADFKIRNGVSKYLLKQVLRPRLPQAILDRPKMGFGTPITVWFRDSLSGYLEDILLSTQALNRGYFRKRSLEKMIHRHRSGLYDYAYHLYALLVLELWHREFPHGPRAD